ncbi:MAG: FadR/GntR family transcriptional regulator [Streptosporangiales bacterium]
MNDVAETTAGLPEAVLRPVRDRNGFESTVEQLASAVRLGVFAAGDFLPPERELAYRLGVSRATVREAIGALRQADLVRTRRGRGGGTEVIYAGPDPDGSGADLSHRRSELKDALDFRRVVEPGAAYLAATRDLTAEQRAWLRQSLAAVEGAADTSAHRLADHRLHLAIVTLSDSPMLVSSVTQAQTLLNEMLNAIPVLRRNIEHSNDQHAGVVAAVLGGDPERARQVMEEHCDATSALLRGLLA